MTQIETPTKVLMNDDNSRVIVPLVNHPTRRINKVDWARVTGIYNIVHPTEGYPASHKITIKYEGRGTVVFHVATSDEALELRRLISNAQKGIFPEQAQAPEVFQKNDTGKPDLDMIPPVLDGVARVMELGAKKYGRGNYLTCKPDERHRYRSAMMRHTEAYRQGETHDESGEHHLAHVAANALILIELESKDDKE